MNEQVKKNMIQLVKESRDAIACSIDENGFPNAKAMFIAKREGIHILWFSTNTSSSRTQQWLKQSKASLYFCDPENIHGLMLIGNMKVYTDKDTKLSFWKQGDEQYYALGPTDPDYCILQFTTQEANYWENQKYIIDLEMIREL